MVDSLRRETRKRRSVRFLSVSGPSGVGKSSVVLAGLVPRVREGAIEGGETWKIATLSFCDNPLENLAKQVAHCFSARDVAEGLNLVDDTEARPAST